MNATALAIANFQLPFEVYCDASDIGLGAARVQRVNGLDRVCLAQAAASRAQLLYLRERGTVYNMGPRTLEDVFRGVYG